MSARERITKGIREQGLRSVLFGYTDLQKVFIMPNHLCHSCINMIQGLCCTTWSNNGLRPFLYQCFIQAGGKEGCPVLVTEAGERWPVGQSPYSNNPWGSSRARPRHVGALGKIIIWRPFKLIFFKYFFKIYLVGTGKKWFSINIYILPVM
jgi:hypothetical protein